MMFLQIWEFRKRGEQVEVMGGGDRERGEEGEELKVFYFFEGEEE